MSAGIRINNLHRSFGKLRAVDGLSFEIPKGHVCGFIGANGAGKTTTMRILCTLDIPDEGSVEINGINALQEPARVRHRLGWMPDHFRVYPHMSVLEFMDFHARALGFRGKERQMRLQEVMEFTDLMSIWQQPAAKLSKGQTQRLCLGRALIHDPDVLVLDEPAAGLDPKARVEFKNLVRILADEGKTLLISSHILSELGEMCQSLVFINKGKVVHQGDTNSLKRRSRQSASQLFRIECLPGNTPLSQWCELQPDVQLVDEHENGGRISLNGEAPEDAARLLSRLVNDGIAPIDFRHEEQNLEDAFINMVNELEKAESVPTGPPPIKN